MEGFTRNERIRMELYMAYCRGELSREEYLRRMLPLDRQIDRLELRFIPGRVPGKKEAEGPPGS